MRSSAAGGRRGATIAPLFIQLLWILRNAQFLLFSYVTFAHFRHFAVELKLKRLQRLSWENIPTKRNCLFHSLVKASYICMKSTAGSMLIYFYHVHFSRMAKGTYTVFSRTFQTSGQFRHFKRKKGQTRVSKSHFQKERKWLMKISRFLFVSLAPSVFLSFPFHFWVSWVLTRSCTSWNPFSDKIMNSLFLCPSCTVCRRGKGFKSAWADTICICENY